jgi:hypothetical protein
MVFAGEVEEAMEEEDFDLLGKGVAVSGGLAGGGFQRDSEIAGVFGRECGRRGKAEDVRGFVLSAEGLVKVAEGRVIGEQDINCASHANCDAGAVEESRQGRRGD